MEIIELDDKFFNSVKKEKRENIVHGIVNNVMSGKFEYHGSGENWNLQDFVNDALGNDNVCKSIAEATIFSASYIISQESIAEVKNVASESLTALVKSFCNQNDIGIA